MAPLAAIPLATWVAIGAGTGIASLGLETVSTVMGAKQNAAQAKTEAELVEQEAKASENLSRQQSTRIKAEARAQISESGAGIEGSPIEILAENAKQAELEALNLRYSTQARVAAKKQEAAFAKKTIIPIILGGTAKAGAQVADAAVARAQVKVKEDGK